MPIELGYFTIPVPDVARATRFYGALFGWTFEESNANYAHVGNTKLPLGLNKGDPKDLSMLYFRVEDIEQMAARVRELGGKADEIFKSDSGSGAVCSDDQGTEFSLWQAAPGY